MTELQRVKALKNFKDMQDDQLGLPLPAIEFDDQDFVLSYFDVYDDVFSTELKKMSMKKQQKEFTKKTAGEQRFVEMWDRTCQDYFNKKEVDIVSRYLKMPNGLNSCNRDDVQRELLRGKYTVKFPDYITNFDSKVFKLAEDPIFYQLYKRGDLISKIKKDPPNWYDMFSRRYLYSVLADEKAIKVAKQLELLKNKDLLKSKDRNGLAHNTKIQSFIKIQIALHYNSSLIRRLADECDVLKKYAASLRLEKPAKPRTQFASDEDEQRYHDLMAKFD